MTGKSTHSIPHKPVTDARPSHAIGHKATSCTPSSSLVQDVAAFFAIVAFVAVFILFAAGLS